MKTVEVLKKAQKRFKDRWEAQIWNDDLGRTHDQVMDRFKEGIAKEEAAHA